MDIRYNSLNLPDGLQFANGNTTNYTYNAVGEKLSVTHQTAKAGVVIPMTNVMTPLAPVNVLATTKTDYCGNVIYENGAISRILTEEGYITLSGTTPIYHYYLKDHQGNNRVVLNQNGTVEQINHYYPFGGLFGESTAGGVQPYKYNGKELDRMHGLDWFDYGARHYNAALGRWGTMDPLAEKYYSISPYAYVANNPVKFVDPDGRSISPVYDRNGNYLGTDSEGFSGSILIFNDPDKFKRDISHAEALKIGTEFSTAKIDNAIKSKILQHVIDGSTFPDGKGKLNIANSQIKKVDRVIGVESGAKLMANAYYEQEVNGRHSMQINLGDYEYTVENVRGVALHEIWGHGIKGYGNDTNTHHKIYKSQIDSKYWKNSTERYKRHTARELWNYFNREEKGKMLEEKYLKEIRKYYE